MKLIATLASAHLARGQHRANLRVLLGLVGALAVIVVVFSGIFHLLMAREGQVHSWVTGVYWTIVAMSTLGFGDVTFSSDLGRMFSVLVVVTGTAFMLILLPFTFIQFFYAPQVARSIATLSFRNPTRRASVSRRRNGLVHDFVQDVHYGLRSLGKAPGFTFVALATLALGIGANTAIFSVVNGVVLRPLPYTDPDRIVHIYSWKTVSHEVMERVIEESNSFSEVSGFYEIRGALTGTGDPEELFGASTSANHFTVLGAAPQLGRTFTPAEQHPGNGNVVILSHRLWRRRFDANPAIIGRTVDLAGSARTVVGVMPATHRGLREGFEFWIPMTIDRSDYSAYSGPAPCRPARSI